MTDTNTIHIKLGRELHKQLRSMAEQEQRTQHNMCIVLLGEAILDRLNRDVRDAKQSALQKNGGKRK